MSSHSVSFTTQEHFSWLASSWAELYEQRGSFRSRLFEIDRVLRGVLRDGDIVVDFGSGAGVFSALVSQCAASVISVDGNAEMLKVSANSEDLLARVVEQAGARYRPERVSRVVGTRECLATSPQADLVLAIAVLEYVPDVTTHLESFASILRPGGYLVLTYPNSESVLRRVEGPVDRVAAAVGHIARVRRLRSREYSGLRPAREADMGPLLTRAGLDIQLRREVPLGAGALRKRIAPNYVWVARRPEG